VLRQRSWPRRLLNRLEVDQAVFYSLLARGWQFAAGPVTLVLIAQYFSPETQGYFYTFAALLGLQILCEMGLHTVVINLVSHEWARLGWDPRRGLVGEESARRRLASLGRQSVRWYGWASLLFCLVIGWGGVYFLERPGVSSAQWLAPWLSLVLISGLQLWTLPLISILEGCNQVVPVNRLRVGQAVIGNLVVWSIIVWGGELWAAVASAAVKLLSELTFVAFRYGTFFRSFPSGSNVEAVNWRAEVWPLQWSVALHSVLQYLAYFLFAPVLFHFHGPQLAGQMGMTWTILTTMQYAAFSWIQTRTPRFGMLIAHGQFRELDRVFFRVAGISNTALLLGCTMFVALVGVLPAWPHELGQLLSARLLPLGSVMLFAASVCLMGWFQCLATYLLAHKRNPLLKVSLIGNLLSITGVIVGGATYGASGAGAALLVVLGGWTLPAATWVWHVSRHAWHQEPAKATPESAM
jgi:hypothetical protein